jgi:DNA-binding response OmpR family regulator
MVTLARQGRTMKRVLVVDDDESVLRFLERGLAFEGYKGICCTTGEAALLEFQTNPCQLVLLDWMLPGMQGDELLLRLRGMQQDLPVIVLSARDTVIDKDRMLKTGADVFLTKPIDFNVLLGHVRELIEG